MDIPSCRLEMTLTILFIFINAVLALTEKSVAASKESSLEKLASAQEPNAATALQIIDQPMPYLSALQIGMTLIGLLNGIIAGTSLAPTLTAQLSHYITIPYLDMIMLAAAVAVILYLTLVIGELLPKNIALCEPEKILCRMAPFLCWLERCLSLPISFLLSSIEMLLSFFGLNLNHAKAVTEDDILNLIEQGTEDGTFEKTEQNMVDNIFHLSDQNAYALMTPRTQMIWIDLEDPLEVNLQIIKDNPDTVFPVAKDNLDEFVGMLYTKDLLSLLLEQQEIDLEKCIHTPVFIPKSMHSFKVLEQFRESGIHEAVVLDEFGGVIGIITMRDIINEVVGDASLLDDDQPPPDIVKRDDHSWLIGGLLPIDDFKEHFAIAEMPYESRDHYHTLGGFITSYLNYIPTPSESFVWNGFRFEIIVMDRARIDKVLVTKLPAEKSSSGSNDTDSDIAS